MAEATGAFTTHFPDGSDIRTKMGLYYQHFSAGSRAEARFTVPYFDASGLGLCTTVMLPTYGPSGGVIGVAGVDLFEIVVRFIAFAKKQDCLRDPWFRFDGTLALLMVIETWIMQLFFSNANLPTAPLRLLRLLRLSRLIRLLSSFPELVSMWRGMWVASRAVFSSLLLLVVFTYVFGIVIHMALSQQKALEGDFASLEQCMWRLIMDGVFLDGTGDVFDRLFELDDIFTVIVSVFVFFSFILFASITLMNMLIGILCEVVSTVTQKERDEVAIRVMKNSILKELKHFDANSNGMISKEELTEVMKSEGTLMALRSLDVDAACLRELQRALFSDAEVAIEGIMELLLSHRGNLPCTVKHTVDAHVITRWSLTQQMKRQATWLERQFQRQLQECNFNVLDLSRRLQGNQQDLLRTLERCPAERPYDTQSPGQLGPEDGKQMFVAWEKPPEPPKIMAVHE